MRARGRQFALHWHLWLYVDHDYSDDDDDVDAIATFGVKVKLDDDCVAKWFSLWQTLDASDVTKWNGMER